MGRKRGLHVRRRRIVSGWSVRTTVLLALFALLSPLAAAAACDPAGPEPAMAATHADHATHALHTEPAVGAAEAEPGAPGAGHDGALASDCCGHCLPHALAGPAEGPTLVSAAVVVDAPRLVPAPAPPQTGRIQPCPPARGPPTV